MSQNEPKLAHNQTPSSLDALHKQQQTEEAPTISGNVHGDVKINKADAHLVHARVYTPDFDPATGDDRSIKRVQSFYPAEFERMVKEQAFAGQKVEVVHDPSRKLETEISEADVLTPKIVSTGAGVGTRLTETLEQKSDAELKEIYGTFFPDAKAEAKKMKREALISEIGDRIAYLTNEPATNANAQIEINRLRAAGYEV